jgi:hypothetical protein
MMTSAALVLFMTIPGLALFYGGLVRRENILSVLAQCLGCAVGRSSLPSEASGLHLTRTMQRGCRRTSDPSLVAALGRYVRCPPTQETQ